MFSSDSEPSPQEKTLIARERCSVSQDEEVIMISKENEQEDTLYCSDKAAKSNHKNGRRNRKCYM